jgi:ribosomal 50S subunit-recycling heat shock protein
MSIDEFLTATRFLEARSLAGLHRQVGAAEW